MKRSKKLISVLLVFMMMTLLVTGCSKEEQKLYGLIKEMGSIEASQQYGEISLNIEQIPQELLAEMGPESAIILEALQNYSIMYEMKQDIRNMNAEVVLFIYDKVNETKLPFITAVSDGELAYVKVDDMVNFIKDFVNDEKANKELDDLFGGAQYIEMENEEIIDFYLELLPTSSESEKQALKNMLAQALDQEAMVKQQEEIEAFINPFIEKMAKTYEGFQTNLVTEEGNKLVVSVGTVEVLDLLKGFINYSIDHADEVAVLLKEMIPVYLEYTQKQMEVLYATQGMEEEMLEMDLQMDQIAVEINGAIDQFLLMLKGNEEEYKAMVAMFIDTIREEAKNTMGDTNLKVVYEKTDDNTYTTVAKLKVEIMQDQDRLAFDVNINDTVKAIDSFEATKPTGKIMDGEVYFQRIKEMMEVQTVVVVK